MSGCYECGAASGSDVTLCPACTQARKDRRREAAAAAQAATFVGIPSDMHYAGPGVRSFAWALDLVFIHLLAYAVASTAGKELAGLVYLAFPLYVSAFCLTLGATPGKLVLGLRIVNIVTGQRPPLLAGVVRLLAYPAAVSMLGAIKMEADPMKQGWHDSIASTTVIHIWSE